MRPALAFTIAGLIVLALLVGCATTEPPRPGGRLTDEDYEMCDRAGGCILMPKAQLFEILKRVREKALGECGSST